MEPNAHPYVFDEFFASGKEECISPFLTKTSKTWGKNLSLKTALVSAFCLIVSFILYFSYPIYSHIFLLIVYFLSGTPALIGAIEDLLSFEVNIDVLMTLAALLSVVIGSGMEGALLLVLFELSASMENAVEHKTKGALAHLHHLSPSKACLIDEEGKIHECAIREISIGASILVKAGEIVPLDGLVTDGSSFVNLSHLTGESIPIPKKVGDTVQAGARNLDGTLTLTVQSTSIDSTLTKIIQLITQAQEAKPTLQKLIDRFDKTYAMSIIGLAFLFAAALPWITPSLPYLGIEGSLYRALTFLIAASPCALVIATPTAYLSAISSCAKNGILLKGGVVLDALAKCHHVAFDKTGTLTTGKLTCVETIPLTPHAEAMGAQKAVAIAATLERHVKHPMADAIMQLAEKESLSFLEMEDFKSIPGFGIEAQVTISTKHTRAYIGHLEYICSKLPSNLQNMRSSIQNSLKEGRMNTFLLIEEALFLFHFEDEIRPTASSLIERLHNNLRMHTVMLTGDHADSAKRVASLLKIDTIYANLRPEDKLQKVAELSAEKGLVMVGDGVNDAPALARATVGISMGKIGSATAVDASDIVFLQDDISYLDWLMKKSHDTIKIVKQNLSLALCVICFATTPALLGFIPLWLAVVLHEGGTVLVGLNSLRLLRRNK